MLFFTIFGNKSKIYTIHMGRRIARVCGMNPSTCPVVLVKILVDRAEDFVFSSATCTLLGGSAYAVSDPNPTI